MFSLKWSIKVMDHVYVFFFVGNCLSHRRVPREDIEMQSSPGYKSYLQVTDYHDFPEFYVKKTLFHNRCSIRTKLLRRIILIRYISNLNENSKKSIEFLDSPALLNNIICPNVRSFFWKQNEPLHEWCL